MCGFDVLAAVSGEVPQEPVVSRKSGHLYEKRLILKHLEADGRDPVTGEDMSADDLLELQGECSCWSLKCSRFCALMVGCIG
jgi:hypothetical protein